MPLIQARYSPEEAAFLTGMPHLAASIEELAQLKGMETDELIPMDALQLKVTAEAQNKFSKAAALDTEACIGCGVCVHKCPTGSLTLERKEEIVDPPKNVREYGMRFMADRKTGVPLLKESFRGEFNVKII